MEAIRYIGLIRLVPTYLQSAAIRSFNNVNLKLIDYFALQHTEGQTDG